MIKEMDRVLRPGGRVVLIVADVSLLREAVGRVGWNQQRFVRVRVLGQKASIQVYRKAGQISDEHSAQAHLSASL